jgi:type IV secretory pathway VirB6-like protein
LYKARTSRYAFIHCKLNKEKTLIKTALVRILTIATLAASLSAFAADESKHNDAATASANSQQEGCAANTHKEKKQKKAKPQRQNDDERTEQEKEFDRVLMGYYGG